MSSSNDKPQKRLKNGCDPYEIGKGTFIKKGQVLNPGGRPKKRLLDEVLEELLEAGDSRDAVAIGKALIKKARKGDSKAAQLVAERTQGKPRQPVEHSGPNGGPINYQVDLSRLNDEQLRELDSLVRTATDSGTDQGRIV